MRLDIKNSTSHTDVPVAEMYNLVGVQLWHACRAWPGGSHVVDDLIDQGFYLDLVDDLPEAPGALGYHDVDTEGRPYSRVGVNPSLQNGSDWLTGPYSVVSVVGHEAIETVGDPIINIWRAIDNTTETAQELCDAVEATGYRHNGADLTNFLYPSWFNPFGTAPFDHLGQLPAPFTMTAGGYMIVRSGGSEGERSARTVHGREAPEWRESAHVRARVLGAIVP